ncbi:hypothetical protein KS461_01170 [Pseudomonas chlororaphis]|uniref:hypothetical protein n=1 Tax=Pseudomonas chlororaphis TaxID=587753 RepID=UPI00215B47B9|nr:hypothetical protein [Pseudomonas chlororaphis]UVE45925.1 hypothetical protein KS461_01170 [Pseudomonas chlororaphis]
MNSFSAADGTIQKITSTPRVLVVNFTDWKEQSWTIIFENLIAFQSIGAEGEEISEIIESEKILLENINIEDIDGATKSYSFISAWSSNPALIIVAKDYEAKKHNQNS